MEKFDIYLHRHIEYQIQVEAEDKVIAVDNALKQIFEIPGNDKKFEISDSVDNSVSLLPIDFEIPPEQDSGKLNVNEPIITTTGLPCRIICLDFRRRLAVAGLLFNLVVAVETEQGEQICLCTETGETRNDLFDIVNSVNLENQEKEKPLISWD